MFGSRGACAASGPASSSSDRHTVAHKVRPRRQWRFMLVTDWENSLGRDVRTRFSPCRPADSTGTSVGFGTGIAATLDHMSHHPSEAFSLEFESKSLLSND